MKSTTTKSMKTIYKDILMAPVTETANPLYTFSFFSGVRGLDIGARKAGFTSLFQSDFWHVAGKAFELNIPAGVASTHPEHLHAEGVFVCGPEKGNIKNLDFGKIQNYIKSSLALDIPVGRVDVIHGGPPCQGFSKCNNRRDENLEKNFLIFDLLRIINEAKPKVGLIEQVPDILSPKYRRIWAKIKMALNSMTEYNWDFKVMNAKYFGARQSRKRSIIILVRKEVGALPSFPTETMPDLSKVAVQSLLPHVYFFSPGQFQDTIHDASRSIFCTMTATGSELFYGLDGKKRMPEMWERQRLTELEGLKLQGISRTHQKTLMGNMVQVSFAEALFLHIKTVILKAG